MSERIEGNEEQEMLLLFLALAEPSTLPEPGSAAFERPTVELLAEAKKKFQPVTIDNSSPPADFIAEMKKLRFSSVDTDFTAEDDEHDYLSEFVTAKLVPAFEQRLSALLAAHGCRATLEGWRELALKLAMQATLDGVKVLDVKTPADRDGKKGNKKNQARAYWFEWMDMYIAETKAKEGKAAEQGEAAEALAAALNKNSKTHYDRTIRANELERLYIDASRDDDGRSWLSEQRYGHPLSVDKHVVWFMWMNSYAVRHGLKGDVAASKAAKWLELRLRSGQGRTFNAGTLEKDYSNNKKNTYRLWNNEMFKLKIKDALNMAADNLDERARQRSVARPWREPFPADAPVAKRLAVPRLTKLKTVAAKKRKAALRPK